MNILHYVKHNTDSFKKTPLNHLDILAFTWLTYFNFTSVEDDLPFYLHEFVHKSCFNDMASLHESFVPKTSETLFKRMVANPRYKDVQFVYNYERKSRSKAMQFGVLAFIIDGKLLICFEGTDLSYVGFKEDFMMSYTDSIASYPIAEHIYKELSSRYPNLPIILSGHSKGGNVAAYCLAALEDDSRIEEVVSYEGPGFHSDSVFKAHPEREAKLTKYVPKESIVGILLNSQTKIKIVRSGTVGILQHNALKWYIQGNDFIYSSKLAYSSRFIDKAANAWINSLSSEEKERFTKLFFDNLEEYGPEQFEDLYKRFFKQIPSLAKAAKNLDADDKKFVRSVIGRLRKQVFVTAGNEIAEFPKKIIPKNIRELPEKMAAQLKAPKKEEK